MDPTTMQTRSLLPLAALILSASCARQAEPVGTQDIDQEGLNPQAKMDRAAEPLELSASPTDALAQLQSASKSRTIAVFKHSPICPISVAAQDRFQAWMGDEAASGVQRAHIDVIAEKPLARGLVAELGIRHESPQLLLFHDGEVVWHASHGAITGEALSEQLMLLEP
jgi:bacillithiol system protein YtxJ